jgi:hypothetical protein
MAKSGLPFRNSSIVGKNTEEDFREERVTASNGCLRHNRRSDRNISTNHPSKEEIMKAINELKNGKSSWY